MLLLLSGRGRKTDDEWDYEDLAVRAYVYIDIFVPLSYFAYCVTVVHVGYSG